MTDGAPPTGRDALHRALSGDQIVVLFQPQVSLRSGAVVGAEALARWEHPRLGTLGAEALFDAAAEAGVAGDVSEHVQALALRTAAGWTGAAGRLRLAVNVTAPELAAPDFAARFLARVAASGFPPGRLTAEVTEAAPIADLPAAAAALAAVRAGGVRVALDDFGTGYSGLAWLAALPVDDLKLDWALTAAVEGDGRARAVLLGTLAIARALGLRVVAEGVERPAQRDALAAAGCDVFQGFLCAGPLDGAALAALAERGAAQPAALASPRES